MKVFNLWIQLLALVALCVALDNQDPGGGKKETTTSATIAWVTITTNGQVNTVKTTFVQTFMVTYSQPTDTVQAGTIGMGSKTGQVGQVRTYSQTTIGSNAAGVVKTPMFGTLCLILGWLF